MLSQLTIFRLTNTRVIKNFCYTIATNYTRSLTTTTAAQSSTPCQTTPQQDNKASPEQLALLEQKLVTQLPSFFTQPHNFQLYTKDVVLIDNIRNLRVQSIQQYALQIAQIKIYHYIKYSLTTLELLNLVRNPEESCLKIRWRIVSKPGYFRFVSAFWKFHKTEIWTDGISTMYVNKDGLIYCHVCDKIDLETEVGARKAKKSTPLINLSSKPVM